MRLPSISAKRVRVVLPTASQESRHWITGLPPQDIHVKTWPGGKKVAVCFVLYVEVWGHGQGPNFRPDMNGRKPDVVDEAFAEIPCIRGA